MAHWLGTHTAYEPAKPTTAVVVDHLPPNIHRALPDLEIGPSFPDGSTLLTLPRYAPFVPDAIALATRGVSFKEIAGNTSAILLTVLAPPNWTEQSPDIRILFRQPLPTEPGVERVALVTPVASLGKTLEQLSQKQISIEHVYDF